MKRWVLIGLFCLAGSGMAEASVLDWPVVNQFSNVVRCVVADAGTIGKSFITHASGFVVETFSTVGKCLLYVADQVTPGVISEPTVPEASHAETPQ